MHRTKRIRENTAGVMQRVDKFHLQLQNLRYEVMHLEKEVTKCLQFRSADEDVQLVPVQEFNAGIVTITTLTQERIGDLKNQWVVDGLPSLNSM